MEWMQKILFLVLLPLDKFLMRVLELREKIYSYLQDQNYVLAGMIFNEGQKVLFI